MGKVGISLTVILDSPQTDSKKVMEEIKKKINPSDMKVKPIGFGLQSIEVLIVREDKEGGDTDAIEAEIMKISGVGSVKTDQVTLI